MIEFFLGGLAYLRRYLRYRRARRILQHAKFYLWSPGWHEHIDAINTITRLQWQLHDEYFHLPRRGY